MMKRLIPVLALTALLVGAYSTVRAASNWYVAPSGLDTNSCQSVAAPCKTIGAAIGKAASGGTINVAVGTYQEKVSISGKNLALIGAGTETTIVDGGIALLATAQVANMTVRNGNTIEGGVYVDSAVTANLSNMKISGNARGILNLGKLKVTNTTISQNDGNFPYGGGLWNFRTGEATLTNVTLSNNKASFGGGAIQNAGILTLSNAIISSNVVSETTSSPDSGEGGGIGSGGGCWAYAVGGWFGGSCGRGLRIARIDGRDSACWAATANCCSERIIRCLALVYVVEAYCLMAASRCCFAAG